MSQFTSLIPDTAGGRSQLMHVLAQPDVVALLRANPELRRILRPLCLMLGIRANQGLPPPSPDAAPWDPAKGGAFGIR